MSTATRFTKTCRRGAALLLAGAVTIQGSIVPAEAATKNIRLTSPYTENEAKPSTTLYLKKGSTFRIKAKTSPAKKLTYKSSKKGIAAVSKKGVIKAKKCGKTKITIYPKGSKKVYASIQVTVVRKLKKVKKLTISKKSLSLTVGSKETLTAKISSPKKPTTKKLNWYSSDKTIVTVSKKGTITAKKAGQATVTVTSADGQGAKASCRITVEAKNGQTDNPVTQKPSVKTDQPNVSKAPEQSGRPDASPSAGNTPGTGSPDAPGTSARPEESGKPANTTPPAGDVLTITNERTGIKQGETLALTASGANSVTWSVAGATGASIDADGNLTVAKEVEAGTELTITAQAAGDATKKVTKKLTVVEDNTPVLTGKDIQLNEADDTHPLGLTYRSKDAYSIVPDPDRGNVIRFDASKGYTSDANDVLAWMEVDPAWAGKEVTISAYMKYEASEDITGKMNLVINERWDYSNPAHQWNAEPDTWYHITGKYTFPDYRENRYNGNTNKLYITRDTDTAHLAAGKNAVYYIDNLLFSVERADIEKVTLATDGDKDEIYQNHDLQCSATVSATDGVPSQKVTYSIEPPVEGASISDAGLLSVKKAAPGAKINVKAASVEDPGKSDTKTITVLEQRVDSVAVSADGSPAVIYQGNELQFSSAVTAVGDPDKGITWSLEPTAAGVSLSKDGLLAVGTQAADGTKLTVKATSVFDRTKSGTYEITVKANKIVGVTVSSAGDKTTVSSALPLALSAVVDNDETTASTDVTWSLAQEVAGVSLSAKGKNATLTVSESVAEGTSITVCATSVFDPTKKGEVTVTVQKDDSDVFDLNRLTVEYWEDFNEITSQADMAEFLAKEDGVISYQTSIPDEDLWDWFDINLYTSTYGLYLPNTDVKTAALKHHFVSQEDYLQFAISNSKDKDMKYTLSFMVSFSEIAFDSECMENINYTLPLKLITTTGEVIKDNINIPYRCNSSSQLYNKEFHEVNATINVPAGQTVYLQLKPNALPICQLPDEHDDGYASNAFHPVICVIDNISIVGSDLQTIEMSANETYQLPKLNTVDNDTVTYYTNSQLAKHTHDDKETTCTRFETTVATVDENGLITANKAGETALIAEIKHENGKIERKQCIIHVK